MKGCGKKKKRGPALDTSGEADETGPFSLPPQCSPSLRVRGAGGLQVCLGGVEEV